MHAPFRATVTMLTASSFLVNASDVVAKIGTPPASVVGHLMQLSTSAVNATTIATQMPNAITGQVYNTHELRAGLIVGKV